MFRLMGSSNKRLTFADGEEVLSNLDGSQRPGYLDGDARTVGAGAANYLSNVPAFEPGA